MGMIEKKKKKGDLEKRASGRRQSLVGPLLVHQRFAFGLGKTNCKIKHPVSSSEAKVEREREGEGLTR